MTLAEMVREVRTRADIAGFIGKAVPLRRDGDRFIGPCPFHESEGELTLTVLPAGSGGAGYYRCSACGACGGIIDFAQRHYGWSRLEAVQRIAALPGPGRRGEWEGASEPEDDVPCGPEQSDPEPDAAEAAAYDVSGFEDLVQAGEAALAGGGLSPEDERLLAGWLCHWWRTGCRPSAARLGPWGCAGERESGELPEECDAGPCMRGP